VKCEPVELERRNALGEEVRVDTFLSKLVTEKSLAIEEAEALTK
jgi:hypothetical protein